MAVLYSPGHSTLSVPEFLQLVVDLSVVINVRSHPGFMRFPHFNRKEMEEWLPAAGIGYEWVPALRGWRKRLGHRPSVGLARGGKPGPGPTNRQPLTEDGGSESGRAWQTPGFENYTYAMAQAEWLSAANSLAARGGAPGSPHLGIMCAEALWWRCHRSLIADYMAWRGLDVAHLQPKRSRHSEVIGDRLARYHPQIIAAWERKRG